MNEALDLNLECGRGENENIEPKTCGGGANECESDP